MPIVESKTQSAPGPEKSPTSRLISGQKVQLRKDAARVQPGPGQKSSAPVIRVRKNGAGQTTIEVQCACGESIEIDIQHPSEGSPRDAEKTE